MDHNNGRMGGLDLVIRDLNDKVDAVYRHSMLLAGYSDRVRDYGEGFVMTEVEAHTLGFICREKEGATVTHLAAYTCRTKGTISKLLKKLEEKGLIERSMREGNRKWIYFRPTADGLRANELHRSYDRMKTLEMLEVLLKECSPEEIESFYKVTALRTRFLECDNSSIES